ncbi:TRAFAC clade GTPase domain-containing protein [Psychrobacter cryohalolentis]|uniref:TRAFAC clade GTPase domain-containing protein n=1 Tax=Psychrobacter cryohalolentis TaxID=330922 RepID=UPI003F8284F4
MNECTEPNCFAPDVPCDMGHKKLSDCKFWIEGNNQEDKAEVSYTDEIILPWTGNALGLTDLEFISGSSRPIVVGIVGAENSGKTTLLASWFLLISRGVIKDIELEFAGSYSLLGWEHVSRNLRWESGQPPIFPPHTPSQSRRSPGLLHLAFRSKKNGQVQDYLFTDAPGEWFQKWAVNAEDQEAEGARWLSDNADVFLLIADTEAFSIKGKGLARSRFQILSQRLSGDLKEQPVALVWSKSDVSADDNMISNIRDSTLNVMPNIEEFKIQLDLNGGSKSEVELLRLLEWITNTTPSRITVPQYKYTGKDPFFMFKQEVNYE